MTTMRDDQYDPDGRTTPNADMQAGLRLDALFEQARTHRPDEGQLARMLRGVPAARERRSRMWRAATGLVASAAAIAGIVLVVAPPGQPQVFAMSQVADAMRDVPLLQMTYSNGMTTWEWRGHFLAGSRDHGRRLWMWDFRSFVHTTYDAERGCIMICSDETPDFLMERTQVTTLESLIESVEARGQRFEDVWEYAERLDSGRRVIVLKNRERSSGAPGVKTMLIDAESRRLTAYTEWGPHTQWVEVRVDLSYPETAPGNIYELGAPSDARVIDGRASDELLALRSQVLAARERGFGAYHMVWMTTGDTNVSRVVSDGRRHRVDSIPLDPRHDYDSDDLAELTARYILTDPADSRYVFSVFDGRQETMFRRTADGVPSERSLTRVPGYFSRFMHLLEFHAWQRSGEFLMRGPDRQDELVGPNEHGWLGYRSRSQAREFQRPEEWEWWFDPSHGYRVAARRNDDCPDAPWQLKTHWQDEYIRVSSALNRVLPDAAAMRHEIDVLEWAELRAGEWYPALTRTRSLVRQPDGTWIESTGNERYDDGYVVAGQVVRPERREKREPGDHPVKYQRVLAVPLDQVEDAWFEIPAEWLTVPAKSWP